MTLCSDCAGPPGCDGGSHDLLSHLAVNAAGCTLSLKLREFGDSRLTLCLTIWAEKRRIAYYAVEATFEFS